MSESASQLEQIVSRAAMLYSRPTVAMEVVRLAEQPRVDPHAIKKCVEQDPALACKVLRVVNSSLFGLQRPVADLNQAIGLLGIKPLKLLVLGFSLPDSLFAEVAARELRWYWTSTLTRAVAARMLSEQLWHKPGDEAFIAGLLQDIGILVLLRELGEPYARFLAGAIQEKCHLAALEQDTLGFDHTSSARHCSRAGSFPSGSSRRLRRRRNRPASRMTPPEGDLPQILHLAELLVQLVGQRQFDVLPDLLEAGKAYRGMTRRTWRRSWKGCSRKSISLPKCCRWNWPKIATTCKCCWRLIKQMATLSEHVAGNADRAMTTAFTRNCSRRPVS